MSRRRRRCPIRTKMFSEATFPPIPRIGRGRSATRSCGGRCGVWSLCELRAIRAVDSRSDSPITLTRTWELTGSERDGSGRLLLTSRRVTLDRFTTQWAFCHSELRPLRRPRARCSRDPLSDALGGVMLAGPPADIVSAEATAREGDVQTVELLNGCAFLAIRDDPDGDVPGMACAPSQIDARRRAARASRIRRTMRSTKPRLASVDARATLSLGDFVPDTGRLSCGPLVGARGVLSGDRYEIPLGVAVPADSQSSLVCSQPEALGGVWVDDAASAPTELCEVLDAAAARIIGQDIVSRWWHDPALREPPVVIPPDELHDPHRAIATALDERGLTCGSYVFSVGQPVVLTILSRPDGSESTFGLAAHESPATAASESVCDAVHARLALQWQRQPVMEPLQLARVAAGWQVGGTKVRYLQQHSRCSGSSSTTVGPSEPTGFWSDLAVSRFDHEPVVVDWPTEGDGYAARVLCPGANVYRRTDECAPFPAW